YGLQFFKMLRLMEIRMISNKQILSFLCVVLISLAGCNHSKPSRPARLQVISMITGVKATVTVSRKSSSTPKSSFSLSYAVSSGYKSFSPGRYDITYVVDGKTILNHTFAIGNNSYQSLLVAGMMPEIGRAHV